MASITIAQLITIKNAYSSIIDNTASGFSEMDKSYLDVWQDLFLDFIMLTLSTDPMSSN